MSEEKPIEDPNTIPMEERVGTIIMVWTKSNQIHAKYPSEPHVSVKMLSVALGMIAEAEMKKYVEIQKMIKAATEPPLILPATMVDPRFTKKQS